MKHLVFYTNCAGRELWELFLKEQLPEYDMFYMVNYEYMENKTPLPVDILSNADIFIYQPVRTNHGIYSTYHEDGILKYLKPDCLRICFPVVAADIFPVTLHKDRLYGPKLNRSLPLPMLLMEYDTNRLSFELQARWADSFRRIQEGERICHIRVSAFLAEHFKTMRLFSTPQHPSGFVLAHIANKILERIGLAKRYNPYDYKDYHVGNVAYEESRYMASELGLKYSVTDHHEFYRKALVKLYQHKE